MQICGVDFEVKEIEGAYYLIPQKALSLEEFQTTLKVAKTHGGRYSRPHGGYVFSTYPNLEATEEKAEPVVEKPVVAVAPVAQAEVVNKNATSVTPTAITKSVSKKPASNLFQKKLEEEQRLLAKLNGTTDPSQAKESTALVEKAEQPSVATLKESVSGQTFEVYQPASFEDCERHFKDVMKEEQFSRGDHPRMLEILIDRCRDDEELRANVLHKDYQKTLNAGGTAWVNTQKREGNAIGMICTPEDIADFVVAEYKKPVKKTAAKKAPAKTSSKPKTKKTTSKKKKVVVIQ